MKDIKKEQRFRELRDRMVNTQLITRGIRDSKVLEAMGKVARESFVTEASLKSSAYEDRPLPIGCGQTISQPYIVALMTEELRLDKDKKVLEVGTGCGYQTAILAEIAGLVYSIEIVDDLYEMAKENLKGYDNIRLFKGDGRKGLEKYAPYDAIIVTAAPSQIPQALIDQLAVGGIMVIPVGPSSWNQELFRIIKEKSTIKKAKICDVAFVPLTRNG